MRALSLFSGVGGIDLGLHRAGIEVVGQCEADAWRRAVLAERFPGVPCWDDVRSVGGEPPRPGGGSEAGDRHGRESARERRGIEPQLSADLVAGGFPCQDVSVAGRRAGLAGERTGLFWEFHRIIDAVRPRWVLLENVPGLLSSNHGRDFATIIDALDGIGYVGAWRVLDSRFFGVPQRRRRVFIVCADARVDPGGERCAEVLAVGTRCGRDHQPSRETREDAARAAHGSPAGGVGTVTAATLKAQRGKGGGGLGPEETLIPLIQGGSQQDQFVTPDGVSPTLAHSSNHHMGHHQPKVVTFVSENQRAEILETDYARQLTTGGGKPGQGYPLTRIGAGVRRLTPRECERLQGFPDDWTLIDWNGKPSPDSRRYAALGDAVTVNVAHWIATRIHLAHHHALTEVAALMRKESAATHGTKPPEGAERIRTAGSVPSTDSRPDDAEHGCCNWCGVRTVEPQDLGRERNRILACSRRCEEAIDSWFRPEQIIRTEPLREVFR